MKVRRKILSLRLSPLERNYLKIVLLAMLLPIAIAVPLVYYLIWENVAQEVAIPEAIVQFLFPAFEKTNHLLLTTLPLIFGGMLLYAALLTNRLLGPLKRVERELEEIARKGDFSRRISIRKKDAPRRLIRSINRLLYAAEQKAK